MATSLAILALAINAAVVYWVLRRQDRRLERLQLRFDLFEDHQIFFNKAQMELNSITALGLSDLERLTRPNVLKLPVIKKEIEQ